MIHFKTNKILYDNLNNNPLNDKEYGHEDDNFHGKSDPIINRLKSQFV